jgi:hypothetical protein
MLKIALNCKLTDIGAHRINSDFYKIEIIRLLQPH